MCWRALTLIKKNNNNNKLRYTIRTCECSDNRFRQVFDDALKEKLARILKFNMNEDQWLQASLPVRNGWLEIRRQKKFTFHLFGFCCFHAPLDDTILSPSVLNVTVSSVAIANSIAIWKEMSSIETPTELLQCVQKAWYGRWTSRIENIEEKQSERSNQR